MYVCMYVCMYVISSVKGLVINCKVASSLQILTFSQSRLLSECTYVRRPLELNLVLVLSQHETGCSDISATCVCVHSM